MLDWVMINNNCDVLRSTDMQFAYKSQHSTMQCTFIANEVIGIIVMEGVICVLFITGCKQSNRPGRIIMLNCLDC